MSIFPFAVPTKIEEVQEKIPRAEEWAWDFDLGEFKTINGQMYKVYDNEAIHIWLWKLLLTERFYWAIHSMRYGSEYENLIGKGYTASYINAVAEQMTREAIALNLGRYIKDIRPMDDRMPIVTFARGTLYIRFYAETIYNKEVVFDGAYNTNVIGTTR